MHPTVNLEKVRLDSMKFSTLSSKIYEALTRSVPALVKLTDSTTYTVKALQRGRNILYTHFGRGDTPSTVAQAVTPDMKCTESRAPLDDSHAEAIRSPLNDATD